MKKLLTVLLTVFMLFNTAMTNTIRADEGDDPGSSTELKLDNEDYPTVRWEEYFEDGSNCMTLPYGVYVRVEFRNYVPSSFTINEVTVHEDEETEEMVIDEVGNVVTSGFNESQINYLTDDQYYCITLNADSTLKGNYYKLTVTDTSSVTHWYLIYVEDGTDITFSDGASLYIDRGSFVRFIVENDFEDEDDILSAFTENGVQSDNVRVDFYDSNMIYVEFYSDAKDTVFTVDDEQMTLKPYTEEDFIDGGRCPSLYTSRRYHFSFDDFEASTDEDDIYLSDSSIDVTFEEFTSSGVYMIINDCEYSGFYDLKVNTSTGTEIAEIYIDADPVAYDSTVGIVLHPDCKKKSIILNNAGSYTSINISNANNPGVNYYSEDYENTKFYIYLWGDQFEIKAIDTCPTGDYTVTLTDEDSNTVTYTVHVTVKPGYDFISSVEQLQNGDLKIYINGLSWIDKIQDKAHIYIVDSGDGMIDYLQYSYEANVMYTIDPQGYIEIPYNAILTEGLKPGNAQVTIYTGENYEDHYSLPFTLIQGAEDVPVYNVTENSDGDIVISSTDKDFIHAITRPYEIDHTGINVGYYFNSSAVLIEEEDYEEAHYGNVQYIYSETSSHTNTEIFYSEDDEYGYATIYNDLIIEKTVLNNDTDPQSENYTYPVEIRAYGYVHDQSKSVHITHGCSRFTGTYTVSASEGGDLYIYSSDDAWLQALTKPYVWDSENEDTENGGSVELAIRDGYESSRFENNVSIWHENEEEQTSESKTMSYIEGDEGEQSYIFIPKEMLTKRGITDGYYDIRLYAYGYNKITYNNNNTGIYLSGYVEDAPEYSVVQDEDSFNLIISSSDENFIRALCDNEDPEGWSYASCYSYIQFDGYEIKEIEFSEGLDEEGDPIYYATATVRDWMVEDLSVGYEDIYIVVQGYDYIYTSVYINHAYKEAPAEYWAQKKSNGDVVIYLSDLEAIEAFEEDGSYIAIRDADSGYTNYINNSYIQVNKSKRQLTISKERLPKTFERAYFVFNIPYYVQFITEEAIQINTLKSVPSDLRIYQDANGNLKITTNSTSYLKTLIKGAKYDDYGWECNNYIRDEDWHEIYNYSYYEGSTLVDSTIEITLSKNNKTATIERDKLLSEKWENGSHTISLYVEGYKTAQISASFSNLSITEPVDENDFTTIYTPGVGIEITCDDDDFLENMMVYSNSGTYVLIAGENSGRYTLNNAENSAGFKRYNYIVDTVNKKITIPENVLKGIRMEDDTTIGVGLIAYGYAESACYYADVEIPEIYEELPEDFEVYFDLEGNLVVESEDDDFLTALYKASNYVSGTVGDTYYGQVNIISGEDIYYEFSNQINPDLENYVSILLLEENKLKFDISLIKPELPKSENLTVIVSALGYETYTEEMYWTCIESNTGEYEVEAGDILQLSYDVEGTITWSVDDESIATIDQSGLLTAIKAGTVEVSANNGTVGDKVQITIGKYQPQGRVTTALDGVDTYGFEVGDETSIIVYDGGNALSPGMFDYSSNNANVAVVDANGTVTAIGKGTATISILYGGTNKSAGTIKVTVIDRQVDSIEVSADGYTEENNAILVGDDVETIQLSVTGKDKLDEDVDLGKVAYVTTDSSVATVDKNGLVTIKKAGQFTITATTTTNVKAKGQVSDSIIIRVLDYTPVLESSKVTVNKQQISGTNIAVYTKYDSTIADVSFTGSNFTATCSDGIINIKATDDTLKNKTYNETLRIQVTAGEETKYYDFALKITLTSALPGVTIKASGTYNSFTNENTLKMTATAAKGYTVDHVEFLSDWASMDTDGNITINNNVYKGKVKVYFVGYSDPVTKDVSFKTVKTAPKYALSQSSITLYVPSGDTSETKDVVFYIKDASKNIVTDGTVTAATANSTVSMAEDGKITLTVPATGKGGTYKIDYRADDWAENSKVTLSYKVTISSKAPTAKLAASSLTLNTNFDRDNEVSLTTSSGDLIELVEITFVGKKNESGPEDLDFSYNSATKKLSVSITDDVEAGTYKYTIRTGILKNGDYVYLKPVTLTVKVEDSVPTVSFKSTSGKFNIGLGDSVYEEITTAVTLKSNPYGKEPVAAKVYVKSGKSYVLVDESNKNQYGEITFLFDGSIVAINGTHTLNKKVEYYIKPVFEDLDGNEVEGKYISYTATFYNAAPKASVSIKGNLNQLDLTAEAVGTVKYTNLVDSVNDVEIVNSTTFDAVNYIDAEVRDGKIYFTLTSAGQAAKLKDGTYKFNVVLTSEIGVETEVKNVSIKLARKAPTLKLASSTINVYDMTSIGEEVARVKLNKTGNGEIAAFSASNSFAYELSLSEDEQYIIVTLKDAAAIKAGSTSKFTIKIDWTGDYGTTADKVKSLKTTTLTLNVKDCSASVKGNKVMVEE